MAIGSVKNVKGVTDPNMAIGLRVALMIHIDSVTFGEIP